ncbi:hypothetical protein JAAARDRAFT_198125 [Jaapia argillacea MUCL 33604]|uniref:Uncharacterized protein n=1 Tax=Jaapia argillacea MUCL 33604 TaxID=933084 RepID=A0A067PF79_9AGAM|nr:hypothetical protein JAAARDRAFT_198125 [Jaapia argillacea MUCL 33604]
MSEPDDDNEPLAFAINLTIYTAPPVLASGKKSQAKPKASTKSKELDFAISPDNYITFLQAVLDCCGLQRYCVVSKQPYPFKKSVTPLDIENQMEYNGMVQCVKKEQPPKITIIIDMNDITLRCCVRADEDVDSDVGVDDGANDMGEYKDPTDLELLGEFWYCPTSDPNKNIKITPTHCCTWCLAIISAKATIVHPPNVNDFDPEKRKATLHPDRQVASAVLVASDQFAPFAQAMTSVTMLAATVLGHAAPAIPRTPTCPPPLTLAISSHTLKIVLEFEML